MAIDLRLRSREAFKYTEPSWADALVTGGQLRLGTLYSFRELEARDAERGDVGEGTRTLITHPPCGSTTTPATDAEVAVTVSVGGDESVSFQGSARLRLSFGLTMMDAYVYCLSEALDDRVASTLGGACVRIPDVVPFFQTLDAHIRHLKLSADGRALVRNCAYGPRVDEAGRMRALHPAFLKESRHAHQRELRGVWFPRQAAISAEILAIPPLGSLCERLY